MLSLHTDATYFTPCVLFCFCTRCSWLVRTLNLACLLDDELPESEPGSHEVIMRWTLRELVCAGQTMMADSYRCRCHFRVAHLLFNGRKGRTKDKQVRWVIFRPAVTACVAPLEHIYCCVKQRKLMLFMKDVGLTRPLSSGLICDWPSRKSSRTQNLRRVLVKTPRQQKQHLYFPLFSSPTPTEIAS